MPEAVTAEDVYRHYGHENEVVPGNGVGYGIWEREDALQRLAGIKDFIKFLDPNKKIRIVFEYDPDFSMALLLTEGMKD
jgi:hypothetical protein